MISYLSLTCFFSSHLNQVSAFHLYIFEASLVFCFLIGQSRHPTLSHETFPMQCQLYGNARSRTATSFSLDIEVFCYVVKIEVNYIHQNQHLSKGVRYVPSNKILPHFICILLAFCHLQPCQNEMYFLSLLMSLHLTSSIRKFCFSYKNSSELLVSIAASATSCFYI